MRITNTRRLLPRVKSRCSDADYPRLFDYLPARPVFDNFAGMPMINVRDIPLDLAANRLFKRAFDIVFSLVAIILTLPVMIGIYLGIRLTLGDPSFLSRSGLG